MSDAKTPYQPGSCGACKHWQRDDEGWGVMIRLAPAEGDSEDDAYDYTSALSERQRRAEQRYGRCAVIDLLDGYEQHSEESLPLAFTKDGSDYKATLYTQAAFGCAMHEASENPPS